MTNSNHALLRIYEPRHVILAKNFDGRSFPSFDFYELFVYLKKKLMDSTLGNPEYSFCYKASQLLPIELWDSILFDHVSDPLDLLYCSRTCTEWERVISKAQKTEFLFPLVIPSIGKYLENEDLLNCRSVCRKWKEAIDTAHFPHWDGEALEHASPLQTRASIATRFNSLAELKEFLKQMETYGGNPFPNRALIFSLTFSILEAGEVDEFYHTFRTLVKKFGSHIWKLTYAAFPIAEFAQPIGCIFKFLPNLQRLSLNLSSLNREEMHELQDHLEEIGQAQPMSQLNHLSVFGGRSYTISEVLLKKLGSTLISYSSWVSDRWLQVSDSMEEDILPKWAPVLDRLPHITEISLKPINLQLLQRFSKLSTWPLRKLILSVRLGELDFRWGCLDLLIWNCIQLLNNFSNSLEEASIQWSPFTCIWPFTFASKLKRVCLCNQGFSKRGIELDDTTLFPSLKILSIPHGLLHPAIFGKLMAKCSKLRQLHVNDLHNRNSKGYVVANQKKLLKAIKELWEEVPSTLQSITVKELFFPSCGYRFQRIALDDESEIMKRKGGKRKIKLKVTTFFYDE